MKVVLLAGGFGTRISEESVNRPKPMIEIGGMPILWHIMKYYAHFGHNEFIICAGYKANIIKEYFANYYLYNSDITFDFTKGGEMVVHNNVAEPWRVSIIDTGLQTMTGGRIKRIRDFTGGGPFLLTYGDGVCDVDINKLINFHNTNKGLLTITAVQPGGRFGVLETNGDQVTSFQEKKKEDGGWINGGFMVVDPAVFAYIAGDKTVFEREPMEKLGQEGKLFAYKHYGFWQCMDTLRDKQLLEDLLEKGQAPWMVWNE